MLEPPEEQKWFPPYTIEYEGSGSWDLWRDVDRYEDISGEVSILRDRGFEYKVFGHVFEKGELRLEEMDI